MGHARPPRHVGEIVDNLSSSGEAPFRSLIDARIPHFLHHFSPPPEDLVFRQNVANR